MVLVVKSNYLEDMKFEDLQSVHVQVDRTQGRVFYYVIAINRGFLSCVEAECITAYQDVDKALDLSDQIKAALKTGKAKLEVSI